MKARSRLLCLACVATTALVASCSGGSGDGTPPTPTAVFSTAPAPSPSPSVSATTVAGISAAGIGPVLLGMPIADVAAAAGVDVPGPDDCQAMSLGPSEGVDDTWVAGDDDAPDLVAGVIAFSYGTADTATGPRTAAGIGLGSSESDLIAAYPEAAAAEPGPYDAGWTVTVDGVPLAFGVQDGTVATVAVGMSQIPPELCG